MNIRRIEKELKDVKNNPIQGISIDVDPNDLQTWKVIIDGEEGTTY